MRDRSAQKDIYIYIKHIKCSNDSSRLWWNWQFCKDLKIGVTPFPSIGLGRRTTTTTGHFVPNFTQCSISSMVNELENRSISLNHCVLGGFCVKEDVDIQCELSYF